MECIRDTREGAALHVLVQPKSSRNDVEGLFDGLLKIRLTAPPIEGKANRACLDYLAKLLNIPKSSMSVSVGLKSRTKTICIVGYSAEEIRIKLTPLLQL